MKESDLRVMIDASEVRVAHAKAMRRKKNCVKSIEMESGASQPSPWEESVSDTRKLSGRMEVKRCAKKNPIYEVLLFE